MRHEERNIPEGKKVVGETHRGKQTRRETLLEMPGEQGEIKTETGREREKGRPTHMAELKPETETLPQRRRRQTKTEVGHGRARGGGCPGVFPTALDPLRPAA